MPRGKRPREEAWTPNKLSPRLSSRERQSATPPTIFECKNGPDCEERQNPATHSLPSGMKDNSNRASPTPLRLPFDYNAEDSMSRRASLSVERTSIQKTTVLSEGAFDKSPGALTSGSPGGRLSSPFLAIRSSIAATDDHSLMSRPTTARTFDTTLPFVEQPFFVAAHEQSREQEVPQGRDTIETPQRTSTALIERAAAEAPTAAPGTMWIYLGDDEPEMPSGNLFPPTPCLRAATTPQGRPSGEILVLSPSLVASPVSIGVSSAEMQCDRAASLQRQGKRELIPPTFRPRRSARILSPEKPKTPGPEWASHLLDGAPKARHTYSDDRPVESFRSLFPTSFDRSDFMTDLRDVLSAEHIMPTGEFWKAFDQIEFMGEGSYGLVWRCRTTRGDRVAVKSCPMSYRSMYSIEDAYSVLREVAIMRFLSAHQVPYVLPLHSAFYATGAEALPDKVRAEVERQQVAKRKCRAEPRKRRRKRDPQAVAVETPPSDGENRSCHKKIPKFISISVKDALRCDGTLFLVTELCDGDVEGIEANEVVTKGVAYCVSKALSEMHKLGILHLDVKPCNILYAFDRNGRENFDTTQRSYESMTAPPSQICSPNGFPFVPLQSGSGAAMKFYLSDFGNCQIVGMGYNDYVPNCIGTYEYMDRRALAERECSRATDCFSFGSTLFELLTGKRLYAACTKKKCRKNHCPNCYLSQAKDFGALPHNTALQRVVACLLNYNESTRLTAAGCLAYLQRAFGVVSSPSRLPLSPDTPSGTAEKCSNKMPVASTTSPSPVAVEVASRDFIKAATRYRVWFSRSPSARTDLEIVRQDP